MDSLLIPITYLFVDNEWQCRHALLAVLAKSSLWNLIFRFITSRVVSWVSQDSEICWLGANGNVIGRDTLKRIAECSRVTPWWSNRLRIKTLIQPPSIPVLILWILRYYNNITLNYSILLSYAKYLYMREVDYWVLIVMAMAASFEALSVMLPQMQSA